MFRLYTKDKQFIHHLHLNKEKTLASDVIDIFTCERYIFYRFDLQFQPRRPPVRDSGQRIAGSWYAIGLQVSPKY